MDSGHIVKVAGPLVVAENLPDAKMYDVVRVSENKLIGEIIGINHGLVSIQVYEETGGIGPGEPVYPTGQPLSVELGPGLITSIYDGIQRPLEHIKEQVGDWITRGIDIPGLKRETKWNFEPMAENNDQISAGDFIGVVQETKVVKHYIMVPPDIKSGVITEIKSGEFTVEDIVCTIKTDKGDTRKLTMMQKWPVRMGRLYKRKINPEVPMFTGQRIIDLLFPIAKGGTACVPGPFGSGKTVVQHQLAKWADAEIIVYIGCGERGNEMTDVLQEFPHLIDPKSGEALNLRTVLIANTSNMPVAAREASIFTGITIAEYFRDMGYQVSLMADSTSRWAEAMREISGRLEEMPGEEGYPAYLATSVAGFYERSGRVVCLGKDKESDENRIGELSVVGAVSPPGGDLSDPVVQATLKVVKVFWSLDSKLAYQRHFPAINWLRSYSLYIDNLKDYYDEHVNKQFNKYRETFMKILQEEDQLQEIVRLVGMDAISDKDALTLEIARSIREDFLHQSAFDDIDTYTSIKKQYLMIELIIKFQELSRKAMESGVELTDIINMSVREEISKMKYIEEEKLDEFKSLKEKLVKAFRELNPEE